MKVRRLMTDALANLGDQLQAFFYFPPLFSYTQL